MNFTRYLKPLSSLIFCCLMVVLVACGPDTGNTTPSGSTPTTSATQSPGNTPGTTPGSTPSPTPVVTTVPMPPTQTSCPTAGTGRAAVTALLAPGDHQNIVYLVKQFSGSTTTSTLKRYDLTTGSKTEILKLPNVSIDTAQISADGQWILFVASGGQQGQPNEIQMVRMDGQGLQTLYCVSTGRISNVLWSSNQKLVLFSYSGNTDNHIDLLNLETGAIQIEVQPTDSGAPLHIGILGTPLTWLDNTRAYIRFTNEPIAPINMLGLLDTSRGPNQHMSDIPTIFQDTLTAPFNYPCWDADSSYDGHTLFTVQCSGYSAPNCSGSCELGTRQGPSTINIEPSAGGTLKAILTSQTLGIGAIRAISNNTLLLQVAAFSRDRQVDTSQNGFWKVNTDGTGLTRLTTNAAKDSSSLCPYSQNPWSNVSRDGTMFAFETTTSTGAYPYPYTLSFEQLSGGAPTSFASIADGTQLNMVGWTTMS